ncbi:MAG: class II D-tagatose-bisphosphate aldolase, non-catalytic subunit [Oscillospiraceae bacterium]|nr:class II D-tagatose-bisphosphate aldolase, non-catalytic subunit [Oscillospiraceae bacterium]
MMDANKYFKELVQSHRGGKPRGIPSVCSAHPYVIQAAMEEALAQSAPVLIEATANQVNQHGGYTGMRPADFRDFVYAIAEKTAFPKDQILLGGDHLGPHPWRKLPAEEAMRHATELVESYIRAGFMKIHIDTSMHLGDDGSAPLSDEVIAGRSAVLCQSAERAAQAGGGHAPIYVVGSEVPPPGGPEAGEDEIHPTSKEAFLAAYDAYQRVFCAAGLQDVLTRIIAFVVQPGVEFVGDRVFDYRPENARALCAALKTIEQPIVFEGHSTDYQTACALSQLIHDGVGILKVGPALTFALREGLFALEAMEKELLPDASQSGFSTALEAAMCEDDQYWRAFYKGDANSQGLQRKYSYYDRARYYLGREPVKAAAETLLQNLAQTGIPEEMLSQYLPTAYAKLRARELDGSPLSMLVEHMRVVLRGYYTTLADHIVH